MAMQFDVRHGSPRRSRARAAAAAGLCALAAAAACVDELAGPAPGSGAPAPVSWMTWPSGIAVGEQLSVRLLGWRPGCGTFVVPVTRAGTRILFSPEEIGVSGAVCPLDVILLYDTTVVVAGVPANTYTMEALTWDAVGLATRAFGTLAVATGGVLDALPQAAGHALLQADSAGCSWMQPQLQNPPAAPFVLASDIALPPGWHTAFVRGTLLQGTARCGQVLRYTLTSSEVQAPPGPAPMPGPSAADGERRDPVSP